MHLSEGESKIPAYLQAFMTEPRKKYFHEKLLNFYEEESSENGGAEPTEKQVVDCLCFVCDEFFRKFVQFLRSQGQTLEVDDVPELSDAFVEVIGIKQIRIGDQTHKVSELLDWEEQMEMLLLEANVIVLAGEKVGLEAVADLARTAVVNDLGPEDQKNLIESFRSEVQSRIDSIVGLEDYQLEELHDRNRYYCDEVFPTDCKEFADPLSCLSLWVGEIFEFISENFSDFSSFLLDLDRVEKVCIKILSNYDGLIEKHEAFFRKLIHESSALTPGPTVAEVRNTLAQLWLKEYMDSRLQRTDLDDALQEEMNGPSKMLN